MRLTLISDTHGRHTLMRPLPEGDTLIHAGDSLNWGTLDELRQFCYWFKKQPHKNKILIAGNHDWCFEKKPEESRKIVEDAGIIYLQDEAVVIDGIKFYGSPWQPEFCDWAFNLKRRGEVLFNKWAAIPERTDVLITHGPPMGILDLTPRGEAVGCELLREKIESLWTDKEKRHIHVFGHIHNGYGIETIYPNIFVNASSCNEEYEPMNEPVSLGI